MVMSIAVKVGKLTFSDFLTVFKNGKLQLCSFPFLVVCLKNNAKLY